MSKGRIDALTEALVLQIRQLDDNSSSNHENASAKLELLSIINRVGNNIRILASKL
jgi:hypothetical protein